MSFTEKEITEAFEIVKPYMDDNGYFTATVDPHKVDVIAIAVKRFVNRNVRVLEEEYNDGCVIIGTR